MICFRKYFKKNHVVSGTENRFWKGGSWAYVKELALVRDNFTCVQCGFSEKEIMQVDHITEKTKGGKNTLENAQTLCPNCHARKTVKFLKTRLSK